MRHRNELKRRQGKKKEMLELPEGTERKSKALGDGGKGHRDRGRLKGDCKQLANREGVDLLG